MTVQIEVSPEAAQIIEALRVNAEAVNLSLEAYLRKIVEAAPLLQTNGAQANLEDRPLSELLEELIGVIDSRNLTNGRKRTRRVRQRSHRQTGKTGDKTSVTLIDTGPMVALIDKGQTEKHQSRGKRVAPNIHARFGLSHL